MVYAFIAFRYREDKVTLLKERKKHAELRTGSRIPAVGQPLSKGV